jgi:hypothetical protein
VSGEGLTPACQLPARNVPSHVKRNPSKWICYELDAPMTIGGGDKGQEGQREEGKAMQVRAGFDPWIESWRRLKTSTY